MGQQDLRTIFCLIMMYIPELCVKVAAKESKSLLPSPAQNEAVALPKELLEQMKKSGNRVYALRLLADRFLIHKRLK